MNEEFEQLNNRFPFLTCGQYLDKEYIGIVQNSDQQFVSIYVLNNIKDSDLKAKFLELGEEWWWESNRKIPINMFIGDRFKIFSSFLSTFISKEFEILIGPTVCLDEMAQKRVKRRSVQLIRKIS